MTDLVEELLTEKPNTPANTAIQGTVVDDLLRGDFSRPTELRAETKEQPDLGPGTVMGAEYRKGLKPASFGTQFQTGFVDDTRTKINIYAKSRGMDPNRYGVDKRSGEIYFIGEDGYAHLETSDNFLSKAKRFLAETAADPSIPLATVLAAAGPWWSALGAAGGEGWRKAIGALLYKEPQSSLKNVGGMALYGAMAFVGEKIGGRIISGIDRAKGKTGKTLLELAGTERYRMDPLQVKRIDMLSQKYGIDLFVPQTTKSNELIARFNLLGDLPITADKIGTAKLKQFGQVNNAINNWLDTFASRITTPGEAGRRGVEAAQAAMKAPKTAAQKASKNFYEQAKKAVGVDISPTISKIDDMLEASPLGGTETRTLKKIRGMLTRTGKDPKGKPIKVPEDRVAVLDKVKKEINSMWKKDPKTSPDIDTQRAINDVLDNMLTSIDEQVPVYGKARKAYAESIRESGFEELGKTKIGQLAKLEGDRVEKAAGLLFSPSQSSPEIISIAKEAIVREGGEDAWNVLLRTHLKQKFRDVVKSGTENIGGMLRKKTWMDIDQREILEAAMNKAQKQDFSDFMEVLERTGLTAGRESTTATRQVSLRQFEEEATGTTGKMARAAAYPLYTWKRIIVDFRARMKTEKYQEMLADAMISGKATKQIQNMLKLTEGSQRQIKALSTFLTLVGTGEYSRKRERKGREEIRPRIDGN